MSNFQNLFSRKWTPLFFLAGTLTLCGFLADTDPITKVNGILSRLSDETPQERLYIQLDKPYYSLTDTIFFKAYLTLGGQHVLSGLSKTLYAELVDAQDSVYAQLKLPVSAGITWGRIALPDTLKEGNYHLRAYTTWMRNEGDDNFFDQAIRVGDGIYSPIIANSSYRYEKNKIHATMHYADADGSAYTGKEIQYEVRLNSKSRVKGKGVTDASGNLDITFAKSDAVASGVIITRLNAGQKDQFTRVFAVKALADAPDLRFYPESGSLISGVRAKVAFKAIGSNGLGMDVKGTILNSKDQEVASFSSAHRGMGQFVLLPDSGMTYRARVTYGDGSTAMVPIPAASPSGFVMTINAISPEGDVLCKLTTNAATLSQYMGKEVSIVAISGDRICYAANVKIEGPVFAAYMPRSKFPEGITRFTLFSDKGIALNERLAYVEQPATSSLELLTDKPAYGTRSKTDLRLHATGKDGKAAVGSYSVSVTDESKVHVDESDERSIRATLLLSSELKGHIEAPNYYFAQPSAETRGHLDLLMLTQGYRKILWKDLMEDKFIAPAFAPERTGGIAGTVKSPGGKPLAGQKVQLMGTGGGLFLLDTLTDANGRFVFPELELTDSTKFVVRASGAKGRKNNVELFIDQLVPRSPLASRNYPDGTLSLTADMISYLKNKKQTLSSVFEENSGSTIRMKEIELTSQQKAKEKFAEMVEFSANLNGPGHADKVIDGDTFIGCTNVLQCLLGRMPGIRVDGNTLFLTRPVSLTGAPTVTIYLDGVQMDSDILTTLNPNDVRSIELLTSLSYSQLYSAPGGVLLITTRRTNRFDIKQYTPYIAGVVPRPYSLYREFYSPKYDANTPETVKDTRSTIYWKPDIITDPSGDATVSFFNAGKGNYRVVVEGIDTDGNLFRAIHRYTVK